MATNGRALGIHCNDDTIAWYENLDGRLWRCTSPGPNDNDSPPMKGARHGLTGPQRSGANGATAPNLTAPTAAADGDHIGDGTPDDEDGVTFGSTIMVGQPERQCDGQRQNAASGGKAGRLDRLQRRTAPVQTVRWQPQFADTCDRGTATIPVEQHDRVRRDRVGTSADCNDQRCCSMNPFELRQGDYNGQPNECDKLVDGTVHRSKRDYGSSPTNGAHRQVRTACSPSTGA